MDRKLQIISSIVIGSFFIVSCSNEIDNQDTISESISANKVVVEKKSSASNKDELKVNSQVSNDSMSISNLEKSYSNLQYKFKMEKLRREVKEEEEAKRQTEEYKNKKKKLDAEYEEQIQLYSKLYIQYSNRWEEIPNEEYRFGVSRDHLKGDEQEKVYDSLLDSKDALILYNLGRFYTIPLEKNKKYEKAEYVYQKTIDGINASENTELTKSRFNRRLFSHRGILHRTTKEYDKMRDDYQAYYDLSSTPMQNVDAAEYLASSYSYYLNDNDAAKKVLMESRKQLLDYQPNTKEEIIMQYDRLMTLEKALEKIKKGEKYGVANYRY